MNTMPACLLVALALVAASCSKNNAYTITKTGYVSSLLPVGTALGDHDRFFVARSNLELTNWIAKHQVDASRLNQAGQIERPGQFIVITVGARLVKVERILGDVVVLSVVTSEAKDGVGISVVEGDTNVFFKFN